MPFHFVPHCDVLIFFFYHSNILFCFDVQFEYLQHTIYIIHSSLWDLVYLFFFLFSSEQS